MDYDDHGLAAMPKLVGGPRYSRPPAGLPAKDRPPDPDDLPLVSERTPEDQALAAELGLEAPPSTTAVAMAVATTGYSSSHSVAAWSVGRGASTADSPSQRRGFSALFRGRNSSPGAG